MRGKSPEKGKGEDEMGREKREEYWGRDKKERGVRESERKVKVKGRGEGRSGTEKLV